MDSDSEIQPPPYSPEPPKSASVFPMKPMAGYRPLNQNPDSEQTVYVVRVQPTTTLEVDEEEKPNNYLILSIFTILCCSWLFGLIALVYSLRVNLAWMIRDKKTANHFSNRAMQWNVVAIITGVAVYITYIVFRLTAHPDNNTYSH